MIHAADHYVGKHRAARTGRRTSRTAVALGSGTAAVMSGIGLGAVAPPAGAADQFCADVSALSQRPTLHQGDTGWCVQELQSRLRQRGYTVGVTSYFGPTTFTLVRKFQGANKLPVTGVVDAPTWLKLVGASQENPPYTATSPYQINRGPNRTDKIVLLFDDCPKSLTSFKSAVDAAQALKITIGVAATGACQKGPTFDAAYARARGVFVIGHSMTHPDLRTLTPAQVSAQIDPISAASGFMRPPYGEYTAADVSVLAKRGVQFWSWTYDSADWTGESQAAAVARIVNGASAGDTVLDHMQWNVFNPSALAQVKAGLAKRGLGLCQAYVGKSAPVKLPSTLAC